MTDLPRDSTHPKAGQTAPMPTEQTDTAVRRAIYTAFAETGRAPTAHDLVLVTNLDESDVRSSLERLDRARVIVLDPASGAINMAMPFSGVPTDVVTRTHERAYYANCAWDALGIAVALRENATIDAFCPDCAAPLAISVSAGRVEPSEASMVAHFAVPPREWWADIGFT